MNILDKYRLACLMEISKEIERLYYAIDPPSEFNEELVFLHERNEHEWRDYQSGGESHLERLRLKYKLTFDELCDIYDYLVQSEGLIRTIDVDDLVEQIVS